MLYLLEPEFPLIVVCLIIVDQMECGLEGMLDYLPQNPLHGIR